jgi:hypothetical protein
MAGICATWTPHPVFSEFLPDKAQIKQPQWSHEMMEHYFQSDI